MSARSSFSVLLSADQVAILISALHAAPPSEDATELLHLFSELPEIDAGCPEGTLHGFCL